jgi:hypothetical protein
LVNSAYWELPGELASNLINGRKAAENLSEKEAEN